MHEHVSSLFIVVTCSGTCCCRTPVVCKVSRSNSNSMLSIFDLKRPDKTLCRQGYAKLCDMGFARFALGLNLQDVVAVVVAVSVAVAAAGGGAGWCCWVVVVVVVVFLAVVVLAMLVLVVVVFGVVFCFCFGLGGSPRTSVICLPHPSPCLVTASTQADRLFDWEIQTFRLESVALYFVVYSHRRTIMNPGGINLHRGESRWRNSQQVA